jgi:hypothetical protein
MFTRFRDALEQYHRKFVILKGTREERMAIATEHIDKLLRS